MKAVLHWLKWWFIELWGDIDLFIVFHLFPRRVVTACLWRAFTIASVKYHTIYLDAVTFAQVMDAWKEGKE